MKQIIKKPSIYKNIPVVHDGIWFRSTKEGNRYLQLKSLQQSGELLFFLRQIPFPIPKDGSIENQTEKNKIKKKVKYVCDFMCFWKDGSVTIEDVKGYKTNMYKTKKKLVEAIYPIKIMEI